MAELFDILTLDGLEVDSVLDIPSTYTPIITFDKVLEAGKYEIIMFGRFSYNKNNKKITYRLALDVSSTWDEEDITITGEAKKEAVFFLRQIQHNGGMMHIELDAHKQTNAGVFDMTTIVLTVRRVG